MRGYWKRFVESVTGFADKYRFDPFFRTEVNIIVLQGFFSVCVLVIVGLSLSYIYHEITTTFVHEIATGPFASTTDTATIENSLLQKLEDIKNKNLGVVTGAILFATIIFGYIIGRITLSPARNALKSQKQFIGNIAHELRTPLSIVKTNTEVTLLDENLNATFRKTLESNVEELNRASDIINNLLSLSSFVRPERMEFKDVNLSEVITAVTHDLLSFASSKHIDIVVRRASRRSDSSVVWGNPTALDQIVRNLVKNAISYTPPGGSIHITVEPAEDPRHIKLTIEDTGIGIARKDLFRIFEPFFRVDRSRNREQGGGSGLGLAIVSELIKIHHGKIVLRSTPGRGTTVVVLFYAGEHTHQREPNGENSPNDFNEISVDFSARKATRSVASGR